MTSSQLALSYGFFWFGFGGCLLALFAYDFFHFLVELLVSWLTDGQGKQS
ncbi:MAG: hypothetical protein ACYDD9_02885 [Acidithiobacillus sp.]